MPVPNSLLNDIMAIWNAARNRAFTLVNRAMVDAYWLIGQRIVEEEQKGEKRAAYGEGLLKKLANELTQELDKKLDERELRRMRQFYLCFPNRDALRPELSWSHYRLLLRVEEPRARFFYLREAADQSWGTRQLERNIQSLYYLRMVDANFSIGTEEVDFSPSKFVKDPYILEFLGIPTPYGFSESELETAILGKLQDFLLEMGKGFAFVARQYSIRTETKQYFIDLVFYNYILKCFVLMDLKITELTHQDIGQMDMYVRMFENIKKLPEDNPTIGIILCSEKDETLVKYSVLEGNEQLFASRYRMVLPSEELLKDEITKAKDSIGEHIKKQRQ